jgi:hypothetical protein
VLYEGEVQGIVPAKDADIAAIGLMMAGVKPGQEPAPERRPA